MPRLFRRLFALALLAFWLPATSHCAIATMAEWIDEVCEQACEHDAGAQHADACSLVEAGDYLASAPAVWAPAPSLSVYACLACLHASLLEEADALAPTAWAKDDPSAWVPAWAFTLRAAPPVRAPDLS